MSKSERTKERLAAPGQLSINPVRGDGHDNDIRIQLTDVDGRRIVDIYLTPEEFGKAITGFSQRLCTYELPAESKQA